MPSREKQIQPYLDKTDFKIRELTRDKVEHFIMIKGKKVSRRHNTYQYLHTQPESTKIYKAMTDLKEETDSNTITVGDLNTSLKQWKNHRDRK